jgi:hypothetical protein
VFSVSNSSTIEIRVYDWNRFASNKILGQTQLKVSDMVARGNVVEDEWLKLDTKGQIRVISHLTPIQPGTVIKGHYNTRLSQLRVHLEADVYYPGQVVRGCVVYGLLKKKKLHSLRVALDGRAFTHWSTGSKHKTHYYGTVVYFNIIAALMGQLDKTDVIELEPGAYIFPFEYVLPMDLPPSFNDRSWANHIRYTVSAHADVAGKANKSAQTFIRLLPDPKSVRPEETLVLTKKLNDTLLTKQLVDLAISGHSTAYIGENYSVEVEIENKGEKAIEAVNVVLKQNSWYCARVSGVGRWVRTYGSWVQVGGWEFKNLAGLPVQPGHSWQGTITFPVPPNLNTSLHSSDSPIIQTAYRVGVKLTTAGNIFTKCKGSSKFLVLMASRNLQFEYMTPPPEPQGPLNELISAPAPPGIYGQLVPGLWNGNRIPDCGAGRLGPIAALPGALKPIQAILKQGSGLVTDADWTHGKTPAWVKPDAEGLSPSEGPADFNAAAPV